MLKKRLSMALLLGIIGCGADPNGVVTTEDRPEAKEYETWIGDVEPGLEDVTMDGERPGIEPGAEEAQWGMAVGPMKEFVFGVESRANGGEADASGSSIDELDTLNEGDLVQDLDFPEDSPDIVSGIDTVDDSVDDGGNDGASLELCLSACAGLECGVVDGCNCGECEDGIPCTTDQCEGGQCVFLVEHEACDDGNPCTENLCTLYEGCIIETLPDDTPCAGTPQHVCVDGICVYVPDCGDGVCDNGENEENCFADCGCASQCNDKECGDDGCGGSCGNCPAGHVCVVGLCICDPDCTSKECGDDGCGGPCGICPAGSACQGGICGCVPDCADIECGIDGCGGNCGTCLAPETCNDEGICVCVPSCEGMECGDDGCGGSCGDCPAGHVCVVGLCICEPDCAGKECGDDSCGGSCGICPAGTACQGSICGCVPDCTDIECGIDDCGGNCGTCQAPETCNDEGICVCVLSCEGKECGDDGCGGVCGTCDAHCQCEEGICVYVSWCGDAACDSDETCDICPVDCGDCCGNDACESGYGEHCGSCFSDCACACGEECQESACVFTSCYGKDCGDDGCGGNCGTCDEHYACAGGLCLYVPWCGDGVCDTDETCFSCTEDCADECLDGCEPAHCSGHGDCAEADGLAMCVCDPGYAGSYCDQCDNYSMGEYPLCMSCVFHQCTALTPTGMEHCYDQNGQMWSGCPGSVWNHLTCSLESLCGQDAQYAAYYDVHLDYTCISAEGEAGDCEDLGSVEEDQVVVDNITGLMWQRSSQAKMAWEEAIAYCEALECAGYMDWRLPSINESESIIDYEASEESSSWVVFGAMSTAWSLTPCVSCNQEAKAWASGSPIPRSTGSDLSVRCVRMNPEPPEIGDARFVNEWWNRHTDQVTGLKWLDEGGGVYHLTWEEALAHCESQECRLPNVKELSSLLSYQPEDSQVTTGLSFVNDYYWSHFWTSTPAEGDYACAWELSLSSAWRAPLYKGEERSVLCACD